MKSQSTCIPKYNPMVSDKSFCRSAEISYITKIKTDRVGMVSLLGPTFRENLTRPLVDQSKGTNPNGVDQVIDFLDHYDLTKEDMDNILG